MNNNICFIVGAERSGSTVLRLMLGHHPKICWMQEFEYAVDQVTPDGHWPDLSDYVEWLSTHRIFLARQLDIDRNLDYPDLVRSFLTQYQQREGKPIIGATVHRSFDRVLYIWPEARFIHIVRDPRDVARSCVAMGWGGNTYTGIARWIEVEKCWDQLRAKVCPSRVKEVRQEDLIREPVTSLNIICDFIGVEYSAEMLSYPDNTTYDAPNPKLVEQWRSKATELEVRLVEYRVGDLLERRGYEPSGLKPLRLGVTYQAYLYVQDRIARIRSRWRRYGFLLWAEDVLSRRLGMRSWQKRIRLQINEINTTHLK